jgi:two-component system sensor histidine kinase AlgZ
MVNYKRILWVLLIDSGVALIPPVLMLAMTPGVTLDRLLASLRFSLVYSNFIGGLAFALLHRMWPVTCLFPRWLQWPSRIAALFVLSVVGGMAACLFFVAVGWIPLSLYWPEFEGSLKIAAFLTVLAGGAISVYESMRGKLEESALQLRTKELEHERALKLATEAQLASLESRIHPHFLFNALNSISSLIPEDPERAERLVGRMAALLRSSLDSTRTGLVPLASELKIVADYLEIEKARFGDRLCYRIDVAVDLQDASVPPLSVQSLVENSVKYSIAPNRAGGEIRVSGARENGRLRMAVSDNGPEFDLESAPTGHGIDNLKGRLAALFADRAALTLEREENRNTVTLSMPINGNRHAGIPG